MVAKCNVPFPAGYPIAGSNIACKGLCSLLEAQPACATPRVENPAGCAILSSSKRYSGDIGTMETSASQTSFFRQRQTLIEALVGLAMLVLTFLVMAASDISAASSQLYWTLLVALFAVLAYVSDKLHTDNSIADIRGGITIVLHWVGVFLAIELVSFFVLSGRMNNADTGLTDALILALGAFLFGIHGNWRFVVIGIALGAATWVVAFVEAYMWVLLGIAVIAILCFVIGARLVHRAR
jgi:hypothetical protein